jgi:hypothetical protein
MVSSSMSGSDGKAPWAMGGAPAPAFRGIGIGGSRGSRGGRGRGGRGQAVGAMVAASMMGGDGKAPWAVNRPKVLPLMMSRIHYTLTHSYTIHR